MRRVCVDTSARTKMLAYNYGSGDDDKNRRHDDTAQARCLRPKTCRLRLHAAEASALDAHGSVT